MFLTSKDLDASIYPEITALMTRFGEAIVNMHIATAVSEIQTMLGSRYDIDPVLAKTGNDRHPYLLSLARDMTIYHIYSVMETIPTHRVKRYDQAIEMLKMMQQGKSTLPGVDPVPVADTPAVSGQIAWGSTPRRPSLVNPMSNEKQTYR